MAIYILKQYHRYMPGMGVGKQVSEWAVEAPDLDTAVFVAEERLLLDFTPPRDFALMWDENGKSVWKSAHA
jgi:hypothetical protein